MSKQQHTPGPWTAVKGYNTAKIWDVYRKGSQEGTTLGTRICRLEDNGDDLAFLQNTALLIAAAPELLEALKRIAKEVGEVKELSTCAAVREAFAAIAKAEGGE